MADLVLDRWRLGDRIGEGGFGRVYEATSNEGDAVVKFVKKQPGADRELLLGGDLAGATNIIPIIESGETDTDWVLVMPQAELSLQDHLDATGPALDQAEAISILIDVAAALESLHGRVVHRDLKPGNILRYQGHWCLADFGISRYAEATTDPATRKFAKTPLYAAPEQWRDERATGAADVYALGVVAFQMLSGRLPFEGPTSRIFASSTSTDRCRRCLASLLHSRCSWESVSTRRLPPGPPPRTSLPACALSRQHRPQPASSDFRPLVLLRANVNPNTSARTPPRVLPRSNAQLSLTLPLKASPRFRQRCVTPSWLQRRRQSLAGMARRGRSGWGTQSSPSQGPLGRPPTHGEPGVVIFEALMSSRMHH